MRTSIRSLENIFFGSFGHEESDDCGSGWATVSKDFGLRVCKDPTFVASSCCSFSISARQIPTYLERNSMYIDGLLGYC